MYNVRTLINISSIIILTIITLAILYPFFVENDSILKVNESTDEYIINYHHNNDNVTKYNYSFPTKKVFIIKLDDVQEYAWNDMFINMTEEILKRNLSVTLSVIPLSLKNDKKAIDFLTTKSTDSRVEIAMHGTKHSRSEYEGLNDSETFNLAKSGLVEIQKIIKVRPITFVPPENKYSGTETTKALSRLGFVFIASVNNNYGFDNYMNYIGFTEATQNVETNELNEINEIIDKCNESLDKRNICVVTMHPQDYVDKDGIMDNTRYDKFIYLLDSMKLVNATSITFKDLMNL